MSFCSRDHERGDKVEEAAGLPRLAGSGGGPVGHADDLHLP